MNWTKKKSLYRGKDMKTANPVLEAEGYVLTPTLGGRYRVKGPGGVDLTPDRAVSQSAAKLLAEKHRLDNSTAGTFVANVPPPPPGLTRENMTEMTDPDNVTVRSQTYTPDVPPGHDPADGRQIPPDRDTHGAD